jgi:hypothetical protein
MARDAKHRQVDAFAHLVSLRKEFFLHGESINVFNAAFDTYCILTGEDSPATYKAIEEATIAERERRI